MSRSKHESCGNAVGTAKKHQATTMETRGENINHSTTGTILKNKDKITEQVKSAVSKTLKIISKRHGKIMEEMEKLLGEQEMARGFSLFEEAP